MSGSSLTGSLLDEQQKSDQIALHVYTKLFHVVYEARALVEGVGEREREREKDRERERERDNKERDRDRDRKPKIDRWFNLETPDSDFFPRELRETYKAISATGNPAPLFIHVLLSVPKANASGAGAGNGNVLVALAQSNTPGTGARISIEPTPRYVLLEKWELKFIPRSSLDHPPSSPIGQGPSAADGAVALPTIYKHGIPLFRSLYSLLRILPVWRLYRRLRKRTTGPSSSQLTILLRVSDRDQVDMQHGDTLLFDVPPSPTHPPLPTQTQDFPPIPHPLGSFKLSTTYLESPTFQLDDLESLLSSRFLNEGFVPTLTSKPRLDATAGTTSSSVTSQASIAEKFVIPPQPSPLSAGSAGAPSKMGAGSGPSPPPPGHGDLSHLRQPSMSGQHVPQAQPHHSHQQSQHSQQQHRTDNSVPADGRSPSPTTLPVLSRLRLESSPRRRAGSLSPSSPITTASPSLPVPASTIPLTTSPTVPASSSAAIPVAVPVPEPAPISGLGLALGPAQHSVQGISVPQARSLPAPPQLSSTASQSPLSQPSSSSLQSGTQALPIRRLSTINPFKANTVLASGTGGGSPAPGSGSGSGSGLGLILGQGQGQGPHGAPGTSAGSIHSIHSVHSPRHASSPLGLGALGEESPSPLSYSQLQQQYHHQHQQPLHPFPSTQHSPQPPYSPPPQLGLGLSPVFGSGSSSSLGSGLPHSPSSPVPPSLKLGQGQGQGQQSPTTPTVPMVGQPGHRKRYSSSFSHRYVASGSVGSAVGPAGTSTRSASPVGASPALGSPLSGLGTREGRESPSPGFVEDAGNPRSRSSSFLGKRTEDDDISMFMQDIETRKPLSGRWRMSVHEREGSGDGDLETDSGSGRHGKERSDETDGTAKAGASEATMKRYKGETSPPASLDAGPHEANVGETETVASHRRASHTYQSYPHQPSPLSPRPRPPRHSPQAQAQAQLHPHSPASPTHGRHRSSRSPSRLPVTTATTTTTASGTMTALPSTSPPGAIPTSQAEVDVRLKKMNETFMKTLAGFGDGWAGGSGSGTRSSGSRSSSIERRSEDGIGTTSTSAGSGTRGMPGHPGRGRDRDRVVPGGLANLSQQGSEEVIGAIELGPDGRQHSLEREQLRAAMGSLKPPSLMRHRGH